MERNQRIEEDLFPFYALDALTDEERAEVEAYIAGNPEARERLLPALSAAADVGAAATPVAPSPEVKRALMARVAADAARPEPQATLPAATARRASPPRPAPAPTPPKRSWWPRLAPAFGVAAAVLLLMGASVVWQLASQVADLRRQVAALQGDAGELQSQVERLRNENQTLQGELAARDDVLAQYRRPGAHTIAIGDATGQNPAAVGTLTMDATTGEAMLAVANLPEPAGGMTYQAWLIVDGAPVSVGTFAVDASGQGTHMIPEAAAGEFDAVGVSLEPAGGSQQPSPGGIVLLGTMG